MLPDLIDAWRTQTRFARGIQGEDAVAPSKDLGS
jgi:hypothetical protein